MLLLHLFTEHGLPTGVIVMTTKKGARRAQKLSVSYEGLYGVTDPGKGLAKF